MSRLIVFDCDGTLVDSQFLIVEAMVQAFDSQRLPPPEATAIHAIIGLSLDHAVARLLPDGEPDQWAGLVASYRHAWLGLRGAGLHEPLYPGVRDGLEELDRRGHLLGVATGKSMPGLVLVLEHHGLEDRFVSLQTADRHPSKPHPGMLEAAMGETGSRPDETVMIGDTSFDMEMAVAAGVGAVGVAWGYHPAEVLWQAGATEVLERFADLPDLVAAKRP